MCVKKYAKNPSKKRPLKKNWKTLDWRHHHHASRDDDDDDDDDDDESERKRAFRVLPPLSFFRGDDEETKDNRAPLLSVGDNRRRRTCGVRYVVFIVRELSSRRSSLLRDDLFNGDAHSKKRISLYFSISLDDVDNRTVHRGRVFSITRIFTFRGSSYYL